MCCFVLCNVEPCISGLLHSTVLSVMLELSQYKIMIADSSKVIIIIINIIIIIIIIIELLTSQL